MFVNQNFVDFNGDYLFSYITKQIVKAKLAHPNRQIINLSIGDVCKKLPLSVCHAMAQACLEFSRDDTFKGYQPCFGQEFLRQSISQFYLQNGCNVNACDIFVNDGGKSCLFNLLHLFNNATCLVGNASYPAYVDQNVIFGNKIIYADCKKDNNFMPQLNFNDNVNVIYLTSPNNPSGGVFSYEELQAWVNYAVQKQAIIIFDSAYSMFVENGFPRSIFEIDGAESVAIEVGSFSKMAGFTGLRCGWCVMHAKLGQLLANGQYGQLRGNFERLLNSMSNGVSYVTAVGANAVFEKQSMAEIQDNILLYKNNAKFATAELEKLGFNVCSSGSSPYVFFACPQGMTSKQFFNYLLFEKGVVGACGEGFGSAGQNFMRFSMFKQKLQIEQAICRLK